MVKGYENPGFDSLRRWESERAASHGVFDEADADLITDSLVVEDLNQITERAAVWKEIGKEAGVELITESEVVTFDDSEDGVISARDPNVLYHEMPAGGWLKWGELQDNITEALIQDEDRWDGINMEALAKRLRSSVEELKGAMEISDPEFLAARRMEKLLELESLRKRGFNWDRVENAALGKLVGLLERGKLSNVEILAVARTANQATRRNPEGMVVDEKKIPSTMVNVQLNQYGQPTEGLPGPGTVGTVTLSLSARTMSQLSRGKTIDGESARLSESVEMLTPKDVPELSEIADKA